MREEEARIQAGVVRRAWAHLVKSQGFFSEGGDTEKCVT